MSGISARFIPGVHVVADLERLGVERSLVVVRKRTPPRRSAAPESPSARCALCEFHIGFGLIALAGQRREPGFVGSRVQSDVGFLNLEFLLGDAQIDAGLLRLDAPDEFVGGSAQPGLLHVVAGVLEIAFVVVGRDLRLRHRLIERRLRLRELRFLPNQLLLRRCSNRSGSPAGLLRPLRRWRHPGDRQIGNDGSVDWHERPALQFAAAADDGQKFALRAPAHGQFGRGLCLRYFLAPTQPAALIAPSTASQINSERIQPASLAGDSRAPVPAQRPPKDPASVADRFYRV